MAPQIVFVTLAADFFQNQCKQVVVGIAVALFGAGSELQGQTRKFSDELLERVRAALKSFNTLNSIDIGNA